MPKLIKTLHLSLVGGFLAASVAAAPEARMYKGYETPAYTVVQSDGPIEIRDYAPYLSAEVTVDGSRTGAANRGFRVLANYIFGGNEDEQKVAMTSPVAQLPGLPDGVSGSEAGDDGLWTVRFMMPREFDAESLPRPENPAIRITTTPGDRQVVIRFSGRWTDSALREHAATLQAWAEDRDLTLAGPPRFYFYDAPFTLPGNRRNEVAYRLQ